MKHTHTNLTLFGINVNVTNRFYQCTMEKQQMHYILTSINEEEKKKKSKKPFKQIEKKMQHKKIAKIYKKKTKTKKNIDWECKNEKD